MTQKDSKETSTIENGGHGAEYSRGRSTENKRAESTRNEITRQLVREIEQTKAAKERCKKSNRLLCSVEQQCVIYLCEKYGNLQTDNKKRRCKSNHPLRKAKQQHAIYFSEKYGNQQFPICNISPSQKLENYRVRRVYYPQCKTCKTHECYGHEHFQGNSQELERTGMVVEHSGHRILQKEQVKCRVRVQGRHSHW